MVTKRMRPQTYPEEMLKRNTRVDVGTVSAYRRLERKLEKLGVEIKPGFNLAPPLGGNRTGRYNRSG